MTQLKNAVNVKNGFSRTLFYLFSQQVHIVPKIMVAGCEPRSSRVESDNHPRLSTQNTHLLLKGKYDCMTDNQCDQIGRFLNLFVTNFPWKQSKILVTQNYYEKRLLLSKNYCGFSLGNFRKIWATLIFYHLVTLLMSMIIFKVSSPQQQQRQ